MTVGAGSADPRSPDARLAEIEDRIRAASAMGADYMTLGGYLDEIDRGIGSAAGYTSFNAYAESGRCGGLSRHMTFRFLRAYQVTSIIRHAGLPVPEGLDLTTSLSGLVGDPEALVSVWVEVVQSSRETGRVITGRLVHEVLRRRRTSRSRETDQARKMHAGVARADRIAALAAEGYTVEQIAARVGIGPAAVRKAAGRHGIEIVTTPVGRKPETNRIIAETVATLEGIAMSLTIIDKKQIDPDEVPRWVESLTESLGAIQALRRTLKERDV